MTRVILNTLSHQNKKSYPNSEARITIDRERFDYYIFISSQPAGIE